MDSQPPFALRHPFQDLPDPRRGPLCRHHLLDILAITICAVLCGQHSWTDIELYGETHFAWLKTFLRLPHGIPSHDTFRYVFSRLDPIAFQRSFASWISALHTATGLTPIAIDGKTIRGSHDRAHGKAALLLVSAWAIQNHLTLGQVGVDSKSNEVTTIPRLLELLDLRGALVTIDAMGCQKAIAQQIRTQGGTMSWRSRITNHACWRTLRRRYGSTWSTRRPRIPALTRRWIRAMAGAKSGR